MDTYKAGLSGQDAAENLLIKKGYKVLARNYRIRTGEIDLIIKDGTYIVFVEVKYRTGTGYGLPREAVYRLKQRRILNTAQHYLARYGLIDSDIRFDVVEVLNQHGQLYASHIENAFTA